MQLSEIRSWRPLSDPFLGFSFLLILQGPEAVAAALAGCKILKEMARLESEAESARSMKEAKYEQFALGEYNTLLTTRADSVNAKSRVRACSPSTNRSHWKEQNLCIWKIFKCIWVFFFLFLCFFSLCVLAVLAVADVFGECYSNSEDRAYALLVRRTHCWSKSTVLNLATEADAKSFFAHDGVQVTRRRFRVCVWLQFARCFQPLKNNLLSSDRVNMVCVRRRDLGYFPACCTEKLCCRAVIWSSTI